MSTDNVRGVKRAVEHLLERGHHTLTYLSGPEASWADAMRWRGVLEAGHELALKVRRLGPYRPTLAGGREAAADWLKAPTTAVITYNDLVAIGFQRRVCEAGMQVPDRRQRDRLRQHPRAGQLIPGLTTISSPLASLGSAAVHHLLTTRLVPRRRTRRRGAAQPAGGPRLDRTSPMHEPPLGNYRQPLAAPSGLVRMTGMTPCTARPAP